MDFIKKNQTAFTIGSILVVGIVVFFFVSYRNDMAALANFATAYEKFDTAMETYSSSASDETKQNANAALANLTAKSTFNLSSLVKHDKEAMTDIHTIVDLSQKGFTVYGLYQNAEKTNSPDVAVFAAAYSELLNQRKTAYDNFKKLGE